MKFTASEPAASGMFPVVSECGHDMGSFKTQGEAQKKAADLNAEYERMSEAL